MDKKFGQELNEVSVAFKLICAITNGDWKVCEQLSEQIQLEDHQWEHFIKLVMHHRVYPSLYSRMMQAGMQGVVPPFVMTRLQREYQRNTFLMLSLCAEMEYVSRLFAERNIRTLFLKGPVLAHSLYGDVSLRTSCDLDLLIPLADLAQAERILLQEGYEKDDYIETVLNDWKWRHHHVTFFHPAKRIKVEIHWRLHPGPAKEPNFEVLWRSRRVSSLTSFPVYYLGKSELFYYLVTHGARHGWSRLRWLMDIDYTIRDGIEWTDLTRLLKAYQQSHTAGQALLLASHILQTPLSDEAKRITDQRRSRKLALQAIYYMKDMINLHSEPLEKEVAAYHKKHLFALMSFKQKFWFILSFFHPYPTDTTLLPLPRKLHFLYFPLRPLLWAWKKTRKLA